MQKAYNRNDWENYPSEASPINEVNLNRIEAGIDEIDNRVISIDLTKLDKTSASGMMTGFALNTETGVITLTFYDGSSKTINTNLAKFALNISYDAENERLVMTMPDGSVSYVNMSALITIYEFLDSDTIYFTVTEDGKVKADIKDGSITGDKLQPNYLADITVQAEIATLKAAEATTQKSLATEEADRAKSEADKAAQYADIVAPGFYVDLNTMTLYMKAGVGVDFVVADNVLCWKIA